MEKRFSYAIKLDVKKLVVRNDNVVNNIVELDHLTLSLFIKNLKRSFYKFTQIRNNYAKHTGWLVDL